MSQQTIRACVSQFPYTVFVTWYYDGKVIKVDRETGEQENIGLVFNIDQFNLMLYDHKIQPIGMGRTGGPE